MGAKTDEGREKKLKELQDHALKEPTRQRMLALLKESGDGLTPRELARSLGIALSLAAYHAGVLTTAKLARRVRTLPGQGSVQNVYAAS